MIIGKSGTTRKRIESETRSRINVPKQGASSDPKSNIPLEKEAFKQAEPKSKIHENENSRPFFKYLL